jgi:hypothetical protein
MIQETKLNISVTRRIRCYARAKRSSETSKRDFLVSDNNRAKVKRFPSYDSSTYLSFSPHITLTVPLIFLLKPLVNNLYVIFQESLVGSE